MAIPEERRRRADVEVTSDPGVEDDDSVMGAGGLPNLERSSPPLLTVLLLLTGEHQEEAEVVKNEETEPLGCGHLRGLFLESQTVLRSVWVDMWVEIQNDFRKRS